MGKRWVFHWLFFLSVALPLRAEEVDQFTSLGSKFQDSHALVEAEIRRLFGVSLGEANQKSRSCNTDRLFRALRKRFSFKNHPGGGVFNKWIAKSDLIMRSELSLEESIYGDFSFWNAPFFFLGHPDSREVQIAGHRLGTDKLDHFFSRGFKYFAALGFRQPSQAQLNALLEKSFKLESGLWGRVATGVFSYGDLAANFHGLRFWLHALGIKGDHFGQELGPYFVCKQGSWALGKSFHLRNYLDDAWDETINCNNYSEAQLVHQVEERLEILGRRLGRKLQCPLSPARYKRLHAKYRTKGLAKFLINPSAKMEVYGE
jgi:hypothetical protein